VDSNEYNSSYRLIFYLDKSILKLVKLKSLHVVKYENIALGNERIGLDYARKNASLSA
jgi:hypothetical protein